MKNFDHIEVEKKWQENWQNSKINSTNFDSQSPFYNLMMFPYPSAEGLHIGSVYTFSGIDTYGRFKRMKGYDVFEPFGLDGFGIHSENYAIKIGEHIKDVSQRTEKHFYEQVKMTGNMIDWDHKLETYKPDYYKWTQWIFQQLYNAGLAYRKNATVNWCPSCKTVLSDEQVEDGHCERCGNEVIQKDLNQWFFKITEYSERLLKNLDWINWDESVKLGQRNWIGKKTGIEITYPALFGISDEVENMFENVILDIDESLDSTKNSEMKTICRIVVKNKDGKILITKRADEHQKDTWDIPGGTIDIAQFEEEVLRELQEETGLQKKFKDLEFLLSYDGYVPEFDKSMRFFCFETTIEDESINISEEHSEFKFVSQEEAVKSLYWEGHKRVVGYSSQRYDLKVFTTRPDTNFGATFLVIAPEHELVQKILDREVEVDDDTYKQIEAYIKKVSLKSELDRISDGRNKTGVFTSFYALNKLNNKKLPIWISDFVLAHFGTGAVVGVPAHDKRDFQFATKFGIDIIRVVSEDGDQSEITSEDQVQEKSGTMINSEFLNGLDIHAATIKVMDFLEEKEWGKRVVNYNLRDWVVSRQRYWGPPIPMVSKPPAENLKVFVVHGTNSNGSENWIPWLKNELQDKDIEVVAPDFPDTNAPDYDTRMSFIRDNYSDFIDENTIIIGHSSGAKTCLDIAEYTKVKSIIMVAPYTKIDQNDERVLLENDLSHKTMEALKKYCNREVDFRSVDQNTNQIISIFGEQDPLVDVSFVEYFEKNLPKTIINIQKNKSHFSNFTSDGKDIETVMQFITKENWLPESDLPVLLPEIPNFEDILPDGSGKGPLEKQEEFIDIGNGLRRETDVSDPFVDSCWYFLRYPFTDNEDMPFEYAKRANLGEEVVQEDDFIKEFQEIYELFETNDLLPMVNGSLAVSALNGFTFSKIEDIDFAFQNKSQADSGKKLLLSKGYQLVSETESDITLSHNGLEVELNYNGNEDLYMGYKVRLFGKKVRIIDPRNLKQKYIDKYGQTDNIRMQILNDWKDQKINKWFPIHSYIGGKEHTVLHLLYARFITMVLNDLDLIDFEEPFETFYGHGLITKDGAKMSKSKGNVINPDEYFEKYGADAVRMYLRFLGPFDQGGDWRDTGMNGMRKFVTKLWNIFSEFASQDIVYGSGVDNISKLHKTIKGVGEDLNNLRFNTAVAKVMEFVNWYKDNQSNLDKAQTEEILRVLVLIIAPMMPHLAEEFWEIYNTKLDSMWKWSKVNSVHNQLWPGFDPKQLVSDEVVIVVQINGKTRGTFKFRKGISQGEVMDHLKMQENIIKYGIDNPKKVIFIQDKIINIIV